MDRLSSYAAKEHEAQSTEERKKIEEEAIEKLMENLRIAKEKKPTEPPKQTNGDTEEGHEEEEAEPRASMQSSVTEATLVGSEVPETTQEDGEKKSITDVKLFEIFHEQVASLVKMQRLPIQDTIALLVSLTKLAL